MSTYNTICEQIKSYDFSLDTLPELVAKAAALGNGGDNRCTSSRSELIAALKVVLNTDRETAKRLVRKAQTHESIEKLRAQLNELYYSKDVVSIKEKPEVMFGVLLSNGEHHQYLVISSDGYGWSEDIEAASKLELKIANAMRKALSGGAGCFNPERGYRCHVIALH